MTNRELLELIRAKKVDMFDDIFESDNYDEYCGYFNQQYTHDKDFHKYKTQLTKAEFDTLYDFLYDGLTQKSMAKLEDVEEEIGIDLVTLFGALKEKKAYLCFVDGTWCVCDMQTDTILDLNKGQ